MTDELPFKVVRSNSHHELLAQAVDLIIALGVYRAAAVKYPEDLIELRAGASGEICALGRGPADDSISTLLTNG
jgi:hypothetical protein